jgi:hypothetical protein
VQEQMPRAIAPELARHALPASTMRAASVPSCVKTTWERSLQLLFEQAPKSPLKPAIPKTQTSRGA